MQPTRATIGGTVEWNWNNGGFFSPRFSCGGGPGVYLATLANYFNEGFASDVSLPAIELISAGPSYEFNAGEQIALPLAIRFLPDDRSMTMVDLASGDECWAIRLITPSGEKVFVPELDVLRKRASLGSFRSRPDFQRIEVNRSRPYVKVLEIGEDSPFTEAGAYKVQAVYTNEHVAGDGEWRGSLATPVFEVRIR